MSDLKSLKTFMRSVGPYFSTLLNLAIWTSHCSRTF